RGGRPTGRWALAEGPGVHRRPAPPAAAFVPHESTRAVFIAVSARAEGAPVTAAGRWARLLAGWAWVPWIWAAGALVSLLPTCAGLFSLWRLGRSSRPWPSGVAQRLLAARAGEL